MWTLWVIVVGSLLPFHSSVFRLFYPSVYSKYSWKKQLWSITIPVVQELVFLLTLGHQVNHFVTRRIQVQHVKNFIKKKKKSHRTTFSKVCGWKHTNKLSLPLSLVWTGSVPALTDHTDVVLVYATSTIHTLGLSVVIVGHEPDCSVESPAAALAGNTSPPTRKLWWNHSYCVSTPADVSGCTSTGEVESRTRCRRRAAAPGTRRDSSPWRQQWASLLTGKEKKKIIPEI